MSAFLIVPVLGRFGEEPEPLVLIVPTFRLLLTCGIAAFRFANLRGLVPAAEWADNDFAMRVHCESYKVPFAWEKHESKREWLTILRGSSGAHDNVCVLGCCDDGK